MIESAKGLILSTLRYSDTSLIIKIFTEQYGKISLIAKGALGNKNKYGASIQPLSYSEIHFYKKTSGLNLLSRSEFVEYFSKIKNNFIAMSFAMGIIESINLTQEENAPNEELFQKAVEALKFINAGAEPITVYFTFLYKLCEIMGFAPSLDYFQEKSWFYFSLNDGKIIQEGFFGKKFLKISIQQLNILKKLQNGETQELFKMKIYDDDRKSLNSFFNEYLSYHLERNFYINSIDLII